MSDTQQPIMYTVSGVDPLFGQRVNCGSYLTITEAVDYVTRKAKRSEYAHLVHINPLGMGYINHSDVVWSSLKRTRA